MVEEERIYTIPLRKAFLKAPRWKRSNKSIKEVRKFLARHMKTTEEKVYIDASINEKIWERGSQKPPSKIRVRTIKSENGEVETELVRD